jgi:hypothetical protein
VVIAKVDSIGVNLEEFKVQRSSCRESTWRSSGNSSCQLKNDDALVTLLKVQRSSCRELYQSSSGNSSCQLKKMKTMMLS